MSLNCSQTQTRNNNADNFEKDNLIKAVSLNKTYPSHIRKYNQKYKSYSGTGVDFILMISN